MISKRGTAIKRRPKDLSSLEGQDFVVQTLKNSIKNNNIANAYIFSGPRGVGKTSSARAFAKCLNCKKGPIFTPCGECESCKSVLNNNSLNIIEIDGASNTSVQDVRQLREEIMFPPLNSRYRIYIIDEVHMLSNSAFNALLKVIEEPPDYIVLIFATTEVHKLPETIKSRCQHFYFKFLSFKKIYNILKDVCKEESVIYEDEALKFIAYKSGGSLRDAYTLFDQLVSFSDNNIKIHEIKIKMGLTNDESLEKLIFAILNEDLKELLLILDSVFLSGISVDQFLFDIIEIFREILFLKLDIDYVNFIGVKSNNLKTRISKFELLHIERSISVLLETYRNLQFSINPRFELEINLIKIMRLRHYIGNDIILKELRVIEDNFIRETRLVNENFQEEEANEHNESQELNEYRESKELGKEFEMDKIDEVFIENTGSEYDQDDKIKERFLYFISKYIQTLVHSGEITIKNNVLYFKVFSEFEYNELEEYKGNIIFDFNREYPKVIVMFLKQVDNIEDSKTNSKIDMIKNIFGARVVKGVK